MVKVEGGAAERGGAKELITTSVLPTRCKPTVRNLL